MELLLRDAPLLVVVQAALPTDDSARCSHCENHEGHHARMAPFDEPLRHVEGLEGICDGLKSCGVCGNELCGWKGCGNYAVV